MKEFPPFFSIVIPTYNRADFILHALNSVFAQSYKNFEVIVIDDGSTDNTEEVLKQVSDSRLTYHKKKNEERAVARNTGAKMGKGKYVTFFDSDDLLYPNHLQDAFEFIKKNNEPVFFHLAYDIKDAKGNLIQKPISFTGNLNDKIIFGNVLSCNGVFIRRDIALQYPFNEDRELSASEDWHLWVRLSARFPLMYSNVLTSTIVNHDSRSVLAVNKEKLVKRMELLIKYLFEDKIVKQKYGKYKSLVASDLYTYIALHLAITKKHRKDAIKYLYKSFIEYPGAIKSRRFYGTIKNLF